MIITTITDLHIAPEGERPFDVDTRQNFLESLGMLVRDQSDLLVVKGDLSYRDADEKVYHWIREQLDQTKIPYRIIGGNHDDSSLLASVFGLEDHLHNSIELYYEEKIPGHHLIYLDSSIGSFSQMQWNWLNEKLQEEAHLRKLIFMHHPPVAASVPYMDKNYPFREQGEFERLLKNSNLHVYVFCGHYHVEKCILSPSMSCFITPSPFFNIDDTADDFKLYNNIPCYRRIQLTDSGLNTSVFYE
ncbi:MAG: metallophosphoesterase [Saprospirales bacterium]|nr:MAG: metallophosphoesterase [Saprospirales bacterium]